MNAEQRKRLADIAEEIGKDSPYLASIINNATAIYLAGDYRYLAALSEVGCNLAADATGRDVIPPDKHT